MKGKDYDNAKIYKLVSTIDDNFYIGSTCTSLTIRKNKHKDKSKQYPERKVCKWINDVGFENIRIILINDDFVCENIDQLRREEDAYIQMYKEDENCLNSIRAYVSLEERKERDRINNKKYKENHREAMLEYNKLYYQNNKQAISETKKRHYNNNKEAMLEYNKLYYQNNKERIAERNKQYREENKEKRSQKIECPVCGCQISKGNMSTHNKSNKHQHNLKANTI